MKTLLLLRHAKSDWGTPGCDDHERTLAVRGRAAAPKMGASMRERGLRLDLVLCSTAVRCRQTLELLGDVVEGIQASIERELYLASGTRLIGRVQRLDDSVNSVLLIAHNPGMADAAHMLAGGGDKKARNELAEKFPTAALAEITFDTRHWNAIGPSLGTLKSFVRPADLTDA
jgi:phosphohistidine phosphatase